MPTRKELLDEIEKDLEVTIDEENPNKNKVDRRKLATAILIATLAYNEDRYFIGTTATLNLAKRRKLLNDSQIMSNFNKELKNRRKRINYGRMVRKQANIYNNQLKKIGLNNATKKLRNRVNNILQSEGNTFRDRGKITAGKVVNRTTRKIVTKEWVWAMYGTPDEPRDSHFAANGQRVPINENFVVGGQSVSAPRQFGDPAEDVNCHCGIKLDIF